MALESCKSLRVFPTRCFIVKVTFAPDVLQGQKAKACSGLQCGEYTRDSYVVLLHLAKSPACGINEKMAGKLPKADPAVLLNSPHHKPSQVSKMDEKQISGLLVLESKYDVHTP